MARKSRKDTDNAVVLETSKTRIYSVGGYVRLSAEDRKQKGDSIETQQAIIAAFIEEHHDLELTDIYIDNGVTGQTFERPAFKRMIADMESGKIDCCVSKDLSRLGRNAIDTGYFIEKFFPAKGIRYIAIGDDYDSLRADNCGIILSLKNVVNEANALETGRKIRQSKQMNIRKGLFVGRIAPYGYMKSKENHHLLVPDSYTGPIVRQMFEMAAGGKKVSEITAWLNSTGVLPPKRYLYSKGLVKEKEAGGHIHWNKGGIYTILKNRVYCGDLVQGKGNTKSYVMTAVPKSEWVVVENTHEAIVSHELFDEVQKLWGKSCGGSVEGKSDIGGTNGVEGKNAQSPKSAKRKPASENIFLRKVFCGHCGYTMRRAKSGKDGHLFKCGTRMYYSKDDCVQVSIGETALREMLIDILNTKADILSCSQVFAIQSANNNAADKAELIRIQAELERNRFFFKSLYESLAQGDITQDDYAAMKAEYEEKIAALSEREKSLRKTIIDRTTAAKVIARAAAGLQTVQNISDLNAGIIDMLIEKIIVYEDKHIEVCYKFKSEFGFMQGEGEAV
jgi:DNA invertase Pin-like site-specific DNA recombinase